MFNLADWKRRFEYNSEKSESNSLMDSGWSKQTADVCTRTHHELLLELVRALAETQTIPADIFDRPELVAVQEAARFATTPVNV
jgi:hypothetical protein